MLMGRVTQHGDTLAVQADLVNTTDGSEIWGAHYERKMADVTEVQSDITRDVAKKLQVNMSGNAEAKMGGAGTTNPDAYRLYLEAQQQLYGRTESGNPEERRVVPPGGGRRSKLRDGVGGACE